MTTAWPAGSRGAEHLESRLPHHAGQGASADRGGGTHMPQPEAHVESVTPAAQQLGQALRMMQRSSGRSLARDTHVSHSSLSRYLRGEIVPAWDVVRQICQVTWGDLAQARTLWSAAADVRDRPAAMNGAQPGGRQARRRPGHRGGQRGHRPRPLVSGHQLRDVAAHRRSFPECRRGRRPPRPACAPRGCGRAISSRRGVTRPAQAPAGPRSSSPSGARPSMRRPRPGQYAPLTHLTCVDTGAGTAWTSGWDGMKLSRDKGPDF